MKKNTPGRYRTLSGMLAGVEALFLAAVIGLAPPIAGLLAGWWGSLPFVPEASIKYFALGGLLLGLLADLLFLRRWVRRALGCSPLWPALLYLFYSAGLFGFFMGVPVFNLLLGLPGGYYAGMRLRLHGADQAAAQRGARLAGWAAAGMLGVACLASWLPAYRDASLAANIQGMFGLGTAISRESILAASALGGIALVALEYLLTRATTLFAYDI